MQWKLAARVQIVIILFLIFASCSDKKSAKKNCKNQKLLIVLAAVDYCKKYPDKDRAGCITDLSFPALGPCDTE